MLASGPLGIGYLELFYLREKLDAALTTQLLRAHSLMRHPKQTMSRLAARNLLSGARIFLVPFSFFQFGRSILAVDRSFLCRR